jgi:DNA-binding NarL/FixJ family response regulator
VLKDDPPEQLIAAVRTIAGGDALLSPAVTKRVIRHFTHLNRQARPQAVDSLTAREMDVYRLITRGLSNAEIGRALFISDTTVKTHVTRLLQKLDLRPLRRVRDAATGGTEQFTLTLARRPPAHRVLLE